MKRFCSYHPAKWEAFAFLMIPVLVGILTATCFGNDIWFLVRTGEEILVNGFPHVDFLTFHENLTLVVQQWLIDVLFFFSKLLAYLLYINLKSILSIIFPYNITIFTFSQPCFIYFNYYFFKLNFYTLLYS